MKDSETKYWAEFWRVTQRSLQRWLKAHAAGTMPAPSDVAAMLKWEVSAKRAPPKFSARCAELRMAEHKAASSAHAANPAGVPRPPAPPPGTAGGTPIDPDWKAFRESIAASGGAKTHEAQIRSLEVFSDGYAFNLERALERGDQADAKHWNALLIDTTNAIRQAKLAADKLGIEEGELFSKAQLARVIRALAFWSMRSVDADLADLCPRLVGLSFVEEARAVLEPSLLSARFVRAFSKAARIESDSSLSPWMVDTMRDAVDDYIEHGAAKFTAEIAACTTLPPSPAPAALP